MIHNTHGFNFYSKHDHETYAVLSVYGQSIYIPDHVFFANKFLTVDIKGMVYVHKTNPILNDEGRWREIDYQSSIVGTIYSSMEFVSLRTPNFLDYPVSVFLLSDICLDCITLNIREACQLLGVLADAT